MIMKLGSPVFYGLMALIAVCTLALWYGLRQKAMAQRRKRMLIICAFNIVFFFIYRYSQSIDEEFLRLTDKEFFNWFGELPLQLCYINMLLIPIGLLIKKRSVMAVAFFAGSLGAFMAILFPDAVYSGFSILLPRMLLYYLLHVSIVVCSVSLCTLGFYRPSFKDLLPTLIITTLLALLMHGVNTLLRVTGICTTANYFFTYGTTSSLLSLFWDLIPIPYVYELPLALIFAAYITVVTAPFALLDRKLRKNPCSA
ncbi:MAG: YwaF family protein [Lachnospiraceae bacterium]|nr:YwaF family protein [Lachnospiraceae bacterium]